MITKRTTKPARNLEPTRTGLATETLQRAVLYNLAYLQARYPELATSHDWYMALDYSVRDRMLALGGYGTNVRRARRDRTHRLLIWDA